MADEIMQYRLQLKAMRRVIEKYADEINSLEVKSIPELKMFINPEDAAVKKVVEKLKQEFQNKTGKPYSSEFVDALCLAAFHFISSLEVIGMDLPVSFWFSPSEVLELGGADAFDRAIFLCSILTSLGASSKVHVLEVSGGVRHPVVIANTSQCYLFDSYPPANYLSAKTQNEVLSQFSLVDKKYTHSLFEFNSSSYEEFE